MQYVALVYYDEDIMKRMTQSEWDSLNQECMACVQNLSEAGHFVTGAPLQSTQSATTVRVRDSQVTVTDGPFAETKEQLAGFYLLEARDLNEALQLAGKIPPARYGSIEVRPVRELLPEGNDAGGGAVASGSGLKAAYD